MFHFPEEEIGVSSTLLSFYHRQLPIIINSVSLINSPTIFPFTHPSLSHFIVVDLSFLPLLSLQLSQYSHPYYGLLGSPPSVSLSINHFDNNMVQSRKFRGVRQRQWGSWVSEIRHPLLYILPLQLCFLNLTLKSSVL